MKNFSPTATCSFAMGPQKTLLKFCDCCALVPKYPICPVGVDLAIEERARGRDTDLLICYGRNDFTEAASCLSFIQ